jgi:hypothetical protein
MEMLEDGEGLNGKRRKIKSHNACRYGFKGEASKEERHAPRKRRIKSISADWEEPWRLLLNVTLPPFAGAKSGAP